MNLFIILAVLGAFQIALSSIIIYFFIKNNNISKKQMFLIIFFLMLYVGASLNNIKISIDNDNDCILFYSSFPEYNKQGEKYQFNFLNKCSLTNEQIEMAKKQGLINEEAVEKAKNTNFYPNISNLNLSNIIK